MGPCRTYKKEKIPFFAYASEGDSEVDPPPPPAPPSPPPPPPPVVQKPSAASKVELKQALKYINPKYSDTEVESIIQYAVKSETIVNVIFSCAMQHGYIPRSW
ncbi:hypothetical protein BT93_I0543 [Corymbia citriodora subsp. variegata]|nr:hypothetical protein BT93_I0543 [Corymbia citriodora subsp. variegata]